MFESIVCKHFNIRHVTLLDCVMWLGMMWLLGAIVLTGYTGDDYLFESVPGMGVVQIALCPVIGSVFTILVAGVVIAFSNIMIWMNSIDIVKCPKRKD